MPDYQRVADDVRNFIQAEDQTLDPATERLAVDYFDAANAANTRLRRCGDLLRRGLRSEAIHLSQEQPDLLDVVAALDVPGLEQWESTCAMYGLAKPPKLMMNVAAELNEAYAAEEPLAASLDELRLLVLARASPVRRLAVTRRLRVLDPDTPHWTSDAIELERACLVTVRQDVARVVATADPFAARQLGDALASPDWIKPPPQDCIDAVTLVEIRGLMQEIAQLQHAGQVQKVRQAVSIVEKLSNGRKVGLPQDLVAGLNESRSWLRAQAVSAEEQASFEEACALLEAALIQDAPASAIETLHARAVSYGRKFPSSLSSAYARVAGQKRAESERGKRRTIVTLVVIAVCVAVGLTLWLSR